MENGDEFIVTINEMTSHKQMPLVKNTLIASCYTQMCLSFRHIGGDLINFLGAIAFFYPKSPSETLPLHHIVIKYLGG